MTEVVYRRKFPCAVCKQEFTVRRVTNGWIGKCGCGEMVRPADYDPEKSNWFERVEAES